MFEEDLIAAIKETLELNIDEESKLENLIFNEYKEYEEYEDLKNNPEDEYFDEEVENILKAQKGVDYGKFKGSKK